MSLFKSKRIFLDYASATPVLPAVRRVMEKFWSKDFYNSSAIYREGLGVKAKVVEARARLARILGVSPDNVIFTSSGTESNNLAILGAFEECRKVVKNPHIIVSAIEHSSVMATAEEVCRRGGTMSVLAVDEEGGVSLEALLRLLKKNTFLVSVGFANSEIGTIQPLAKVGRLLREYRKKNKSLYPYLHTDASQASNYLDIGIESLQTDLLTLDGSKVYGPKGVGVLVLRKGVKIHPVLFGGRQEGGRRAGTISPALIAGFVRALEIVQNDKVGESERLEVLRRYFINQVGKSLPRALINGSTKNHLPNIVSVSLPGTLAEFILLKLDQEGVMVSVGSACSYDERVSGSPVIIALGKRDLAEATLRFSFGRHTSLSDVRRAVEIFCRVCKSVLK